MRVERVDALGFGPLSGAALELAEGMTLVFGPNEAGKSSWHGALQAGVCGLRRGRGPRSAREQEFESRHRPWDGGSWNVRAVVVLADGRRVELTQNLAGREGTAIDLATGRDLTSGILTEQVPDASRWLGLDRDAFRSVACVPQTALLQIRQEPGQLARHLQRAAATAGTDATAADAIRRIDGFLTDQVGTGRAWTKPLARARDELAGMQGVLSRARQDHADLASLREDLREASEAKQTAERRLRAAEAADIRRRADMAHDVWSQAAKLAAKYPEPPRQLAAYDNLAQRARAAVDGYRNRPAIAVLEGLGAEQLESELASLPETPVGDITPAPAVEDANEKVRAARAALRSVADFEPAPADTPVRTPAETSELRELASMLSAPLPAGASGHDARAPQRAAARPAMTRAPLAAGAAAILLIAGVAIATVIRQPLGWAVAAAGAVIGGALVLAVLRAHARQIEALSELQTAGAMRVAAEQRFNDARTRIAALNLPADPDALRDFADADDHARATADQRTGWRNRHAEAESGLRDTLGQLSRELSARGVAVTQDPEADLHRYMGDCADRRQQADEAGRRPDLESRFRDRQQAETQAATAASRRLAAEQELRAAASACQLPEAGTAGAEDLASAIETWLEERGHAIGQHQEAVEEYAVLQQLLSGGTPDELLAEARRLADAVTASADGLEPAEIADADPGPGSQEALSALRDDAREARDNLTRLQATVREREQGIPNVSAAEEEVAQASARAERLEWLSRILGATRGFLAQAQDSVHRSIAPQLASAIAPHLGAITSGRYTEVAVDPDDLQVRVRAASGTWREADRLSHGTAEQVYLLLRAALAEYLATTGEPCPLILDDPTAYADDARTTAVLEVLHHLSTKRQVIIFSHDIQVLAWARETMTETRDRIVELSGTA